MTEQADTIAEAVQNVPGVAGLHAGTFGEVGTYLPGRRVPGIRIRDGATDVHVSLFFDATVGETAARIREAVAPLAGGIVNVTVEDIVEADEADAREAGTGQ